MTTCRDYINFFPTKASMRKNDQTNIRYPDGLPHGEQLGYCPLQNQGQPPGERLLWAMAASMSDRYSRSWGAFLPID